MRAIFLDLLTKIYSVIIMLNYSIISEIFEIIESINYLSFSGHDFGC